MEIKCPYSVEVISSTTFSRSNFLSTILNKQSDDKYMPIIISNTSYNTIEFFSYGGIIICINLKNKFILTMIFNNFLLKSDLTTKMT